MDLKLLKALESEAEAGKEEAEAREAELDLHERLASQFERRQYFFDGELDFESIADCIDSLDHWRRLDAGKSKRAKAIHLVINGSAGIIQALALHDQIRWLRQDGFHVTVEVAGAADKQAVLILQAANRRLMTNRSWLEIEQVAFSFEGDTFLSENELAWMQQLEAQQRSILSQGCPLSDKQIENRMHLQSWRLSAQDALAYGLIDEISTVASKRLIAPVPHLVHGDLPEPKTARQRKTVAEIRKMRAQAKLQQLEDQTREGSAAYNGVVRFINEVDTDTVAKAKSDLADALRLSSAPITLFIDSNGGSCIDGFGFIDVCEQVANSGRELNTQVVGYAASMGGVMLQVGKKRTMGKNAWLLIHRVSSWFENTTSHIKLDHQHCMQIQRQCFELLASRSVFTADQILARCRDHDWWITAEEALKYGFIDQIR